MCDTDLECLAVFHNHGLIFNFFFFLRNDICIPHPPLCLYLDFSLSVFVLAPFDHFSIVAHVQLDPT